MTKFTPILSQALGRAVSAYNAGKLVEAEQICQQIITIKPALFDALHLLAAVQSKLGKKEMALVNYNRALKVRPDSAEVLSNRGVTLHELKRFKEALASYDRALKVRPDYAEALSNRGHTLSQVGELDAALVHYRRALALKSNLTNVHVNMGNALKELGQLQEAQKAYLDAIRLDPGNALAYVNLVDSALFLPGDPHLAAMEALAAKSEGLSKTDRMWLAFALGKAYADLKDFRRSFQHFLEGNAAKRAMISYDERSALAFIDRIEAVFTPELIKAKSGGGENSPRPIFVIGMPRSGTTLVEQIIASHPMVHGAGELDTLNDVILAVHGPDGNNVPFPECVPALDASTLKQIGTHYVEAVRKLAPSSERVTDKTLQNYLCAGLIHLALPNAKIIHTVRNPVDTCVSCFTRLYSAQLNYTCDLGELGRYYKRHEGLMAHWHRVLPPNRILDVRYEEVVADLEGQARRIISHCGLSWDERCLSFHQTIRPVRTASATQVRQPIYKTAVGRWRDYEEQLGPLLSALGIVTSVEE
jgi:Flp pilus assembly protein TadD